MRQGFRRNAYRRGGRRRGAEVGADTGGEGGEENILGNGAMNRSLMREKKNKSEETVGGRDADRGRGERDSEGGPIVAEF